MKLRTPQLDSKAGARVYAGKGYGYYDRKERVCMTRCFECGKENYAMTVSSGYCAWCGYDANPNEDRPEDHLP